MIPKIALVSIDFETMPADEGKVSVFDRGFLFGDSVYEVIRTYGPRFLEYERHFARLKRSAESVGFELPFDEEGLKHHLDQLVQSWGFGDCCVRVIVTRGSYDLSLYPPEKVQATTVVIAGELPAWPLAYYEQGIVLKTVEVRRNSRGALNPMIKSGNYLNNLLAAMEARKSGAVDAIMLNEEGHVTESSTANIFIVQDGTLVTPPVEAGILDGVSRHAVLRLAENKRIPCRTRLFKIEALHGADECFITSTTREVMPVRRVDAVSYASPGPLTLRIMELYRDYIQEILKRS